MQEVLTDYQPLGQTCSLRQPLAIPHLLQIPDQISQLIRIHLTFVILIILFPDLFVQSGLD